MDTTNDLTRCMGGSRCNHAPVPCASMSAEYQARCKAAQTTKLEALKPVTQADRDLFTFLLGFDAVGEGGALSRINSGEFDGWVKMQAIAQHRTRPATSAEPVAWLYELFDQRDLTFERCPKRISWTETPLYASPTEAPAMAEVIEVVRWVAGKRTSAEVLSDQGPSEWTEASPERRIELMGERKRKHDEMVERARTALNALEKEHG